MPTITMISIERLEALESAEAELRRLQALVNTPELVDFPKAVHLEAVHQLERWGTADRQGKTPYEWYWLLSHLATRALEHHKSAERLVEMAPFEPGHFQEEIAHHREKAVHHCVTSAAVLAHWHASMLGKHTAMRPGAPLDAVPVDLR